MGICGPLETESNMFKISIKLILVGAPLQPKGLLHVLSANHCACVCVYRHFSMFVVRFMFVCVLSGLCFTVCVREKREGNECYILVRIEVIEPIYFSSSHPIVWFPAIDHNNPTSCSPSPLIDREKPEHQEWGGGGGGGREEGEEKGKGIILQSCKEPHRKWKILFCPNVISSFLSASL